MNVPPAGPAAPNLGASLPPGGIPTTARGTPTPPPPGAVLPQNDQIASLLQLLATPEISDLIFTIEQRFPAQDPALLEELLQSASAAVEARDLTTALAKIEQFVTLNPQHVETIANHPSLQTIRGDITNVVSVLAANAKAGAEVKVAAAGQAIAANDARKLPGSDVDLATVLSVATRFLDSGRITDYRMAGELAQVVTAHYGWAPAAIAPELTDPRVGKIAAALKAQPSVRAASEWVNRAIIRLNHLWLRGPLLVLLLAWLALGLIGGGIAVIRRNIQPDSVDPSNVAFGFSIWGLGFLALAGFGFYVRIRNIRFK